EEQLHRHGVSAREIPRVVQDETVAVALRQLRVEEVERTVERVAAAAAHVVVRDAARALQRVSGAELDAADVAAVHLNLQRLIVAVGEVPPGADVLVAAGRTQEIGWQRGPRRRRLRPRPPRPVLPIPLTSTPAPP